MNSQEYKKHLEDRANNIYAEINQNKTRKAALEAQLRDVDNAISQGEGAFNFITSELRENKFSKQEKNNETPNDIQDVTPVVDAPVKKIQEKLEENLDLEKKPKE